MDSRRAEERRFLRRRGLARALLQTTFSTYWKRGTKCVTLELDAKSLTNAVSLYEGVGMVVETQYTRYEKLIHDGQELSLTAES